MSDAEIRQLAYEAYVLYFVIAPAVMGIGGLVLMLLDFRHARRVRQMRRELEERLSQRLAE